jgi:hypothetical protein
VAPGTTEIRKARKAGSAMMAESDASITDFSAGAFLDRGADVLLLLLFAAMIVSGAAYAKRRGGLAPRIFAWSALAGLVVFALWLGATFAQEGLRASSPSRDTPGLPVSYEGWDFLGSLAVFLSRLALAAGGIALVFVGWSEGRRGTGRVGAKRRRR